MKITENDILQTVVAVCAARDDENLVGQTIEQQLDDIPKYLHAVYLKITLRVVVAQMYGALARRIETELDPALVDQALAAQGLANESDG